MMFDAKWRSEHYLRILCVGKETVIYGLGAEHGKTKYAVDNDCRSEICMEFLRIEGGGWRYQTCLPRQEEGEAQTKTQMPKHPLTCPNAHVRNCFCTVSKKYHLTVSIESLPEIQFPRKMEGSFSSSRGFQIDYSAFRMHLQNFLLGSEHFDIQKSLKHVCQKNLIEH